MSDTFTRAYIQAALWSSHDNSDESGGDPFDKNYGAEDLSREAMDRIERDCKLFQETYGCYILEENRTRHSEEYSADELAGHDFWLTRCGHGSGFWDGDWKEPVGTLLTEAAHSFGEIDLELGDDGKIHIFGSPLLDETDLPPSSIKKK